MKELNDIISGLLTGVEMNPSTWSAQKQKALAQIRAWIEAEIIGAPEPEHYDYHADPATVRNEFRAQQRAKLKESKRNGTTRTARRQRH